MEDKPKVSIALCTFNGAPYLREQLDSIIHQSYPELEIIAMDDASTDETWQILKEYEQRSSFLKSYRNDENLGLVENFQKALRKCSGDLIALADQDDIWDLNKIAKQVDYIKDNLICFHDSEFVDANGNPLNQRMSDILNLGSKIDPRAFLFHNCISGHSIMMQKRLLNYALPFSPRFYHDWWLAYVASNLGTVVYLPEVLVKYRQHGTSDTNILDIKREDVKKKTDSDEYHFQMAWLRKCSSFTANRHPRFVSRLVELFKERNSSYLSLPLFILLSKHSDLLLSFSKASRSSKRRWVVKHLWGIKGQNYWYRVFKPDESRLIAPIEKV